MGKELRKKNDQCEWLTFNLIILCYLIWTILLIWHSWIPIWLLAILGATVCAFHASLQHEALHGHPFRSAKLNELLVSLPLLGFFPYRRFRTLHLTHHNDEKLTDPFEDPETWYLAQKVYAELGPLERKILEWNRTLLGRMLIGPVMSIVLLVANDWREIRAGSKKVLSDWLHHLVWFVLLLTLLIYVFAINPLLYLVCFAYPGFSLLMLRTFIEHQASENADDRSAIIESGPFFSLLFLNNNLHLLHHQNPRLPWYKLPALLAEHKNTENEHTYVIKGYRQVIWQYLFKAKEPVVHPYLRKST